MNLLSIEAPAVETVSGDNASTMFLFVFFADYYYYYCTIVTPLAPCFRNEREVVHILILRIYVCVWLRPLFFQIVFFSLYAAGLSQWLVGTSGAPVVTIERDTRAFSPKHTISPEEKIAQLLRADIRLDCCCAVVSFAVRNVLRKYACVCFCVCPFLSAEYQKSVMLFPRNNPYISRMYFV